MRRRLHKSRLLPCCLSCYGDFLRRFRLAVLAQGDDWMAHAVLHWQPVALDRFLADTEHTEVRSWAAHALSCKHPSGSDDRLGFDSPLALLGLRSEA